jgi:hypothetical protein
MFVAFGVLLFVICLFAAVSSTDKITSNDEMDRHVARIEEKPNSWWESQKERYHWDDQDVGGRIILRWILEK